ncbi:glycosyl hydrolase 5 family protein-like [Coffea arabica]|uniref:Glycosyl hydrolase 5 family protein-like n=1 Tax=Coffea arabica TaxID=13443 RepID=A0ABM4VKR9_COFAR
MAKKNSSHFHTFLLWILLFSFAKLSKSLPLSTSSRWILDDKTGSRVKLTCVNWVGHLEPLVVEGLQKKPLPYIVDNVALMGFNCVRLTWATFMFTRENYGNLTVRESLNQLSLDGSVAGIAMNNPQLLDATVVEVQKAVVYELGRKNIMVILDNHVSKPQWCCGGDDGNGFFGDEFFDPKEWLQGLAAVANLYKDAPNVVAMSMRNELRGPRQNTNDWYEYIPQGAAAIHGENPSLLIIVSGLGYETDLSFVKEKPLVLNFTNKLVYEAHWYAFDTPWQIWLSQTNQICAQRSQRFADHSAFVVSSSKPVPLFLSEFGADQRGGNEADNRYLSCLLAFVAEHDLDWALWTLQGSYILRQGVVELEEVYGMFDVNWDHIRNSTLSRRLQLVKQIIWDPKSNNTTHSKLYHPQSGLCAQIGNNGSVRGSDCQSPGRWKQQEAGSSIQLEAEAEGTFGCLRAVGDGQPATVSSDCGNQTTLWKLVSSSQLHIAAQGGYLCLEMNSSDSVVVTRKCLCLDENSNDVPNCAENPEGQWFKLVPTNES